MKYWYDVPTQVKVESTDDPDGWDYGIAYQGYFICGCCGGVFELDELAEDGLEIVDLPWVSLHDEIKGE